MIGFLNINKPVNITSAQVVAKIKHLTHEKVGHLGTLDPLASGVLPVAVGKATRLFDYFLNKDKVYIAKAKFGILTNTLDLDGEIIKSNNKVPTKAEILAILPSFIGKQLQVPPLFSAKNVNGVRAYELARKGKEVKLEPKAIEIYNIELLNFEGDEAEFKIHCSSGTYVRSLIRDIALALKTIATTSKIFRIQSGMFKIENAYNLDELNDIENKIISLNEVFKDLPKYVLSDNQKQLLLNGVEVKIQEIENDKCIVLITEQKQVYGLAQIINGRIYVKTFLLEN